MNPSILDQPLDICCIISKFILKPTHSSYNMKITKNIMITFNRTSNMMIKAFVKCTLNIMYNDMKTTNMKDVLRRILQKKELNIFHVINIF